MRRFNFKVVICAGLLASLLASCQPAPDVTPTATRTPAAPIQPTATASPTTIPITPSVVAPSVPAGPFGPDDYPADVNPLTGLHVDDPSVLARTVLAIKVSNDPLARPQSGLGMADIVFEHYAEGGVTRFTALYYEQAPEVVGSIRSGRLLDFEIVPMFDAVLAASGFSDGVMARIQQRYWFNRVLLEPVFGVPTFERIQREDLALEHTLFARPNEIWNRAEEGSLNNAPDLTPGLAFRGVPPEGGTPASQLTIDFSIPLMLVDWEYDPALGQYLRSMDGKPHVDYLTGEQLSAANVLAVAARHVDTDILEDSYSGLWSVEIQLWGEGPASLFRDGQRYEGSWSRTDAEQMLQFKTLDGEILYLKPGRTWFEILPLGFNRLSVEP